MNTKHTPVAIFLILYSLLIGCVSISGDGLQSERAYLEPGLLLAGPETEGVPVIITARDTSSAAARAVERLGGQVTSDLWLIDAVAATIPVGRLQALAAQPGIRSIVRDKTVSSAQEPLWDGWAASYTVPVPYDGSPDALPTGDPTVWDLVNPVPIDVGADILHRDHNITGQGVTVAVLDSGVYFSPAVRNALPDEIAGIFRGQADFVGAGLCQNQGNQVQYDGYCFSDKDHSYDG
jgi:subtilisin family serine protease